MALKKSEITRRRKNQSAQRAEQDKLDTINRLLKKQAGKHKKGTQDEDEGGEERKADTSEVAAVVRNRYMIPSSYLRTTYRADRTSLSIPLESLEDVPEWMQRSIRPMTKKASSTRQKVTEHKIIEVLETPIAPLKEPRYPAKKGKCSVSKCEQAWKYRGPKSKKVACGLDHLKLVEAGV
jgi:hypothetical protein